MYKLFEDEGPKVTERIVTAKDRVHVSKITYIDVANLFPYRIGARPGILPYMDMIRWVIDHMNIADRNFMTQRQTIIGSFTAKDLSAMYHLLATQKKYDK